MSSGSPEPFRLGFLAALEDAERGVVGGLLVTNRFGRPLEFQCTTPVKPNRTQQILYGPTLRPFLLAEVIGRTLVEKVGIKPHLVLVESAELLELRAHVDVAVAGLSPPESETAAAGDACGCALGRQRLRFHAEFPADQREIAARANQVPDTADLQEPFERIREALSETLKASLARSA
jgi:hypothetical protein